MKTFFFFFPSLKILPMYCDDPMMNILGTKDICGVYYEYLRWGGGRQNYGLDKKIDMIPFVNLTFCCHANSDWTSSVPFGTPAVVFFFFFFFNPPGCQHAARVVSFRLARRGATVSAGPGGARVEPSVCGHAVPLHRRGRAAPVQQQQPGRCRTPTQQVQRGAGHRHQREAEEQ